MCSALQAYNLSPLQEPLLVKLHLGDAIALVGIHRPPDAVFGLVQLGIAELADPAFDVPRPKRRTLILRDTQRQGRAKLVTVIVQNEKATTLTHRNVYGAVGIAEIARYRIGIGVSTVR